MSATAQADHIRFCTTSDGVKVAFATAGVGYPLVKTPNWLNHLELDVQSPVWRGWIREMTRRFRLVRYDARGCGLSDRELGSFSFATNLLDLEAVVEAAGLDRFVLFGASQGAAIAIEYAAKHPERVTHLVLYGSYLRGVLRRDPTAAEAEEARTLLKVIELGWGKENSAFRQLFATQFIPDSTLEQLRGFDDIQRRTVSAEGAAKLLATFYEIDISALAGMITCPTLVLHARKDARIPFEQGRRVAAAIRGAEFVPLESRNHILLEQQPAWRQFFDEVDRFMKRTGDAAVQPVLAELTASELKVLDLLAATLSNPEIAAALNISSKTVRNHINHIFGKLGVRDRAQAIVLARDAGLGKRKEEA